MKLIVNEETEPRMDLGRCARRQYFHDSNMVPLMLLLAADRNTARPKAKTNSSVELTDCSVPSVLGDGEAIAEDIDAQKEQSCAFSMYESAALSGRLEMLQAQLAQAQKMGAIGNLARGVLHDVNNLLMVMSSHSELALAKAEPAVKHHLQQVLAALQRASQLTGQLLVFSRDQVTQVEIVNLSTIVRTSKDMLACLAGKNVALEFALDQQLGSCKINPVQLQQVLMNLVVNARDAMPDGGRLFIETSNEAVSSPDTPNKNFVVLTVRDTGVGMTQATQERIFQPFFSTKEPGKGTGLGLSTVDDIVKQNRGHILVDSEIGRGTTFRVYLPAMNKDAASTL